MPKTRNLGGRSSFSDWHSSWFPRPFQSLWRRGRGTQRVARHQRRPNHGLRGAAQFFAHLSGVSGQASALPSRRAGLGHERHHRPWAKINPLNGTWCPSACTCTGSKTRATADRVFKRVWKFLPRRTWRIPPAEIADQQQGGVAERGGRHSLAKHVHFRGRHNRRAGPRPDRTIQFASQRKPLRRA